MLSQRSSIETGGQVVGPASVMRYLKAAVESLRPSHWGKNLLLLVPVAAAHELTNLGKVVDSLIAFATFSCCASSVYLFNDLMDLNNDRRHPWKRNRPIASGRFPAAHAVILGAGLVLGGFAASFYWLPFASGVTLAIYLGLNLCYTLSLKRKIVIDVIMLAVMYCLRIVAGGVASGIPISEWLLALSLFLFTSLAFAKRYAELGGAEQSGHAAPGTGRGYRTVDMRVIESIGPASGLIAVLVMALYINSADMQALYRSPECLWLVCPLLLYWICRLWMVAGRREMIDDPLMFAMTDWRSVLVLLMCGAAVQCARFVSVGNIIGQ